MQLRRTGACRRRKVCAPPREVRGRCRNRHQAAQAQARVRRRPRAPAPAICAGAQPDLLASPSTLTCMSTFRGGRSGRPMPAERLDQLGAGPATAASRSVRRPPGTCSTAGGRSGAIRDRRSASSAILASAFLHVVLAEGASARRGQGAPRRSPAGSCDTASSRTGGRPAAPAAFAMVWQDRFLELGAWRDHGCALLTVRERYTALG